MAAAASQQQLPFYQFHHSMGLSSMPQFTPNAHSQFAHNQFALPWGYPAMGMLPYALPSLPHRMGATVEQALSANPKLCKPTATLATPSNWPLRYPFPGRILIFYAHPFQLRSLRAPYLQHCAHLSSPTCLAHPRHPGARGGDGDGLDVGARQAGGRRAAGQPAHHVRAARRRRQPGQPPAGTAVAPTVSPSPCVSHCVSLCLPLSLPHRVSLTVSPHTVSLTASHRVSHCVLLCLSLCLPLWSPGRRRRSVRQPHGAVAPPQPRRGAPQPQPRRGQPPLAPRQLGSGRRQRHPQEPGRREPPPRHRSGVRCGFIFFPRAS
jgi:hypothetical protein